MDNKYLKIAISEAKKSFLIDEVPVGCVIVKDDKVIAKSHNMRQKKKSVIAHAEILSLIKASKRIKDWQLIDSEVYVTLEPCAMCASALIQSRVKKIYYGCKSLRDGALGSCINLLESEKLNHIPECVCLENTECADLLKKFFKKKREEK